MDPQAELEQLARDTEHGASEITRQAARILEQVARQADQPMEALAASGARLVRAHPAMAPLVNLVDGLLTGYEEVGQRVFERARRKREARQRALARQGADRIQAGDQVATYSRSGTVLAALRRADRSGTRFSVLVSEARPGQEGLTVVRELAGEGVPVTVTTDAALGSLVQDADLLLVGADAICARGLVNKVGTGPLAREAARAGVPAYVLAGTDKLLPDSYRRRPPLTAHGSMGHDLPEGALEASPVFECEPLEPFEAVLTEEGTLSPEAVHDRIGERSLDPRLRRHL